MGLLSGHYSLLLPVWKNAFSSSYPKICQIDVNGYNSVYGNDPQYVEVSGYSVFFPIGK